MQKQDRLWGRLLFERVSATKNKKHMPNLAENEPNIGKYLKKYIYQSDLTSQLDLIGNKDIDLPLLHEIVLWKVNRYPRVTPTGLNDVNKLKGLKPNQHQNAKNEINSLLNSAGIDLPMASTILRFRNPEVFQIIDRHAYRALYGKDYPIHSASTNDKKVALYFKYLADLHNLAAKKKVPFRDLDRILYVFDKEINGKL